MFIINHAAFQDKLLLEYASSDELTAETRRICEVNMVGPTVASVKALPLLEATGGRLVFVSSGSSIVTPPFHAIYGGSKSGMNGILAGLRSELLMSGHHVSISVLVLGLIGTDANVNRGNALASQSMPVTDCAAGMLCAIDARMPTAYVPQMLSPYSTMIHFFPGISDSLIRSKYLGT